jgi:hypothetical protein
MQRSLEQLTKELATVERELTACAAAVDRQTAALDRFVRRFGRARTRRREQLEHAKLEADSRLAQHRQRRDGLLETIERKTPAPKLEHGGVPPPDQQRTPGPAVPTRPELRAQRLPRRSTPELERGQEPELEIGL